MGGKDQGVQMPWGGGTLASRLFAKSHPTRPPRTGRCQYLEEKLGRTRQGYIDTEGSATDDPPGGLQVPGCRLRAAKGGSNRHGNGSRCKHATQGAGMSGRGWRAADAVNIPGGGALRRERRWGAVENLVGFK